MATVLTQYLQDKTDSEGKRHTIDERRIKNEEDRLALDTKKQEALLAVEVAERTSRTERDNKILELLLQRSK